MKQLKNSRLLYKNLKTVFNSRFGNIVISTNELLRCNSPTLVTYLRMTEFLTVNVNSVNKVMKINIFNL